MLLKDFYKIVSCEFDGENIEASIVLNPDHDVYNGHFPGQPVVPGVIQLQIVKELVEKSLNKNLFMNYVSQVKYLVPIVPEINLEILIKISLKQSDENLLKAKVVISSQNNIFTKAGTEFVLQ